MGRVFRVYYANVNTNKKRTMSLVEWRIYCNTEGDFQSWYLPHDAPPPTTCPNDTLHDVNPDSVNEVTSYIPNEFTLKEEERATGGHFFTPTIVVVADCDATTTYEETMFVDTNTLGITFTTTAEHTGDTIQLVAAPNTTVGGIAANVALGDTVITVQPSVIANVFRGPMLVTLDDGTNTADLGRIKSIDSGANTLTVETPSSAAFAAATPTLVKITVERVRNMRIGAPSTQTVGDMKLGASFLPQDTLVRMLYTNRSKPWPLGQITVDVASSATVIDVDDAVLDAVEIDDKVDLHDGTNNAPLGQVTSIDKFLKQITVATPAAQAFAAATPTYVRKTSKTFVARVEQLQ